MQVVAVNPRADLRFDEKVVPPPSCVQRNSGALKAIGALGVLAFVGAVGYIAGGKTDSKETGNSDPILFDFDDTSNTNSLEAAQATLWSGYQDQSNLALTDGLTIDKIDPLVDQYEENPLAWFDNYITDDLIQSFKKLRDAHTEDKARAAAAAAAAGGEEGINRRLRTERNLAGYNTALVNAAYELVENANWGASDVIKEGDDFVLVKRVSGVCYIMAQPSNSANDWFSNLNAGNQDLYSILDTYQVQDESCGCKRQTAWWCSEYNTCRGSRILGKSYKGFTNFYNKVRTKVWAQIQSKCSSSDTKVFSGYSRGGAIVTNFAFAAYTEGLIPTSRLKLVTFGSPRVLGKSESDSIHGKFEQWRMVYKKDPVPSLPPGWFNIKHVGSMHCFQCGYETGRDKPSWSWLTDVADHLNYCKFFGNGQCK